MREKCSHSIPHSHSHGRCRHGHHTPLRFCLVNFDTVSSQITIPLLLDFPANVRSRPRQIPFRSERRASSPCLPARNAATAARGHRSCPESEMSTGTRVRPESLPTCSIAATTSRPLTTFPNTTCLPSSQGVLAVQRKNCAAGVVWRGTRGGAVRQRGVRCEARARAGRRGRSASAHLRAVRVFPGVGHAQGARSCSAEVPFGQQDLARSKGRESVSSHLSAST